MKQSNTVTFRYVIYSSQGNPISFYLSVDRAEYECGRLTASGMVGVEKSEDNGQTWQKVRETYDPRDKRTGTEVDVIA